MKLADLVRRVDELLIMGAELQGTRFSTGGAMNQAYVADGAMAGFRTASLSFISRVYGADHIHFSQFIDSTKGHLYTHSERAIAILRAIRSELDGGWLFEVRALVAAELYSDFLEQADHLLEQGYKDAAAVMIGSVLEEHLRQLCPRYSVDTHDDKDGRQVPRKADRINADLAKASAYSALESKQITAWLAIRNSAAHGKYSDYTQDQIVSLALGVPSFILRNPS